MRSEPPGRRLEACRQLGWEHVAVTVVDLEDILRGQYDENKVRKDFTVSEEVAIFRALEEREREGAKQRQREHGGTAPGKHSGKVSTSDSGRTRDKAASYLGRSGKTLEKAKAVVEAAEAEPDKYQVLVEEMDRTGRVKNAMTGALQEGR